MNRYLKEAGWKRVLALLIFLKIIVFFPIGLLKIVLMWDLQKILNLDLVKSGCNLVRDYLQVKEGDRTFMYLT